jgi:ABC-type Fe3+ transport system substrate-binding protein
VIGKLQLAAAIVLAASAAQAQTQTFQQILDGAKKEGALTVAVSSPGLPATHAALFEAFNKRFGLSIKGEWQPLPSPQTGTRVIAEGAAGNTVSFDVIGAGSAQEIVALMDRSMLKPYPWADVFGKELPSIKAVADSAMANVRGYALPILDVVYGLAWNTNMLKDSEVPAALTDLLDPKWKGKVSVNALVLVPMDLTSYIAGKDKAIEFSKKLLDNNPVLERGTPAVTRAVSTGQAPLGITSFHTVERGARSGEPMKFRVFSDYILHLPAHAYVPEKAPHPNAARLFTAWLATEGVAIADKFEPTPVLADPNAKIAQMVKEQQAKTGAKISAPPALKGKEVEENKEVRDRITEMLTGKK